jgi:hypothetical protein
MRSLKNFVLSSVFIGCAAAQCPISSIKVDRYPVPVSGGYLVLTIEYTNSSSKTIVGAKYSGVWIDVVGDVHSTLEAFSSDSKVKAGATKKDKWKEPSYIPKDRKGWLIAPVKILYGDGSSWQTSGSDKNCFGQTLWGKMQPLKEAPELLFK